MIQSQIAPATLLPAVLDAVADAGALIRAEFHCPGGPRGRGGKAAVDIEVETLLKSRLLALHSCGFLGEETAPRRAAGDDLWVVDPQDGTSDFLAGHRGSAVSVALLRRERPVLGVVFAPLAPDDGGDLIAWAKGAALTRNGQPVRRAGQGDPITVALNAQAADYARHNHATLPGLRIRALPSPAYRLALAAVGEVDAAVSLTQGLAPWDIAGGHALLLGAGCTLVDLAGRPVDDARGTANGVIGGDPVTVARLVALAPRPGPRETRHGARPKARSADAGRLARAQGCLLGQLSGDALGSAVEFGSAASIARSHKQGVTRLVDGGTWNLIAGQPTDDSEMALALARALVAKGGFDAATVAQAYIRWRDSAPFDIGMTTSAGIAALARGAAARPDSQSNGALMRVSPVGILAAGDPALAARLGAEDASLTHPHPVCVSASAALAAAIAVGVAGGTAEQMMQAAEAHAGESDGAAAVRERLALARRAPPAEFQRQMGWVLTALQNAFFHLLRGTPLPQALPQALTETVGQGGDTDTNAAICGALLGAAQGREAIPLQWRNAVLTCRPIKGPGIRHPRPREYWPDDALDLAEALLTARNA
ncbi:inositol monophosphatase family protein [Thetidibacter halocola]|uniref:ADP-ribosylglycohydrolase family protein n=1 Tax=Thetidibacter halocola TaxID=2827239 RepID=A0A8J8B7Y5_9RHOB|nr:inositol monophosphatase family protein [Thetidibacter halocola]MBS0122628.1 ADP-ribosylglycohydrolase family protein [Thetidibacter halocola]